MTTLASKHAWMVLCQPNWGAHGENEYSSTLPENLTLTTLQLPNMDIYMALEKKTPIGESR